MNKDKDYCTPADIFTEHGMRKVKKDYKSVDLKLAITNLVRTVDEQESETHNNCHCEAHEVSCGNLVFKVSPTKLNNHPGENNCKL